MAKKLMFVAASAAQVQAYLTGASINNYPDFSAVPTECQAPFGTRVCNSCCINPPFQTPGSPP